MAVPGINTKVGAAGMRVDDFQMNFYAIYLSGKIFFEVAYETWDSPLFLTKWSK
jgi:hypothetical protein